MLTLMLVQHFDSHQNDSHICTGNTAAPLAFHHWDANFPGAAVLSVKINGILLDVMVIKVLH